MYHTVVMTCGVSLLKGDNLFSIKEGKRMEGILKTSLQSTELTSEMNKELDQFFEHAKLLFSDIPKNPHLISAEYSLVHTLRKQNKVSKDLTIVLIVTKTFGGAVCERILRHIFESTMKANVKVLYTEMSVSHPKELNQQAAKFLRTLGDALSEGEPTSTCFAPIGGYKVMTSLGYIVGSFLHFPTAYLHEEHQILVEIPPMPLDVDEDFVRENSDLLRKCQLDIIKMNDLMFGERQLVQKHTAIFSIEDQFVSLSPFGEFLFEREKYKNLFDTKCRLSEQVQRFMTQNKHQSIFITQQLRELVKKVKYEKGSGDELFHERTFKSLDQKKVLYHLYKGASNGQTAFRLAYQYDNATDILIANYLWLDHQKYEREAAKGIGLFKSEKLFSSEISIRS